MNHNKICGLEDFADPDLVAIMRDVERHKLAADPRFPSGTEHRKDWEVAMAVRALRDLGALGPDATILGVAAGTEDSLFWLTGHARQVFATDRYLMPGDWGPTAPVAMLVDPGPTAPYPFDDERLVVQHMDARSLRYPDGLFDGIFSSGSIEHVGELADVANAAFEMGRVLKPGGILSLSTEFKLAGPPDGCGWPGLTLLFAAELLSRWVVEASGLDPVDELDTSISDATMATSRPLSWTIADHQARVAAAGSGGPPPHHSAWTFPHVVLTHGEYTLTSVHLALRKTDRYLVAGNEWATPSPATRAAIRAESLAGLGPPRNDDAVPTTNGAAAGAAAGNGLHPSVVELPGTEYQPIDDGRGALERAVVTRAARATEASTGQAEVDALRAEVKRADALVGRHHGDAVRRAQARATATAADGWTTLVDPLVAPEADRARWRTVRLATPTGVGFDLVLDPGGDDLVGTILAEGRLLEETNVGLMLELVRPGDLVVDLGAHLGQFTLSAAAAGCRVLAVEASPTNAALLRASVSRNGFTGVRVVHAAVGDTAATVSFHARGPWGHVEGDGEADGTLVTVAALTLDDLLAELGWSSPDLVKIDVEGAELRSLRGMAFTLAQTDAPPVLFESNGHTLAFNDLRPRDLLAQLAGHGYASHLVEPDRLVAVDPDDLQPQTIVDYLAFKDRPVLLQRPVAPSLTFDERVGRIVSDLRFPNEDHRAHTGARLAGGDAAVLSHPAVVAALDDITADPVPAVRQAVAWWAACRPSPAPEAPPCP